MTTSSSSSQWLTIIGLGEDGLNGLTDASLKAVIEANEIWGAARHIDLVREHVSAKLIVWPVPYSDGVDQLIARRGRPTVVLASGDPFWFGAGSVLTQQLDHTEWTAHPNVSAASLVAARLGWPLEKTHLHGLHAAPFARVRSDLYAGARLIATLRDGDAVAEFAEYLAQTCTADLWVCEAIGGPNERIRKTTAIGYDLNDVMHPVIVGVEVHVVDQPLSHASGRSDDLFDNDGQITKRPVRALTLSALAPRANEHLWDIGGGSGSIALEWLMSHPTTRATAIEQNQDRAARIQTNAAVLGQDRLEVVHGTAPDALAGLDMPDVVFIGGGLSQEMFDTVQSLCPSGARLVCNAVTLEAEALLAQLHGEHGGDLVRIELAQSAPLGRKRGWKSSYPIAQWSVTL